MDAHEVITRIFTVYDEGHTLAACAWCGRVRLDERWIVAPRAALAAIDVRNTLSHSICDECVRER